MHKKALPTLEDLTLNGHEQITDQVLRSLAATVGTTLTSVFISHSPQLTDSGVMFFLKDAPHLTSFRVPMCGGISNAMLVEKVPVLFPKLCTGKGGKMDTHDHRARKLRREQDALQILTVPDSPPTAPYFPPCPSFSFNATNGNPQYWSCACADVACSLCGRDVLICALEDHLTLCPKQTVPCVCCQLQVVRDQMSTHWVDACNGFFVKCTVCYEMVLRKTLSCHIVHQHGTPLIKKECPLRVWGCLEDSSSAEDTQHSRQQ